MKKVLGLVLSLIFTSHMAHYLASQSLNDELGLQANRMVDDKITYLIGCYKKTKDGEEFLKKYDEHKFHKTIAFLQNPIDNFTSIQDIADLCTYFLAFTLYVSKEPDTHSETGLYDFFQFLNRNYQTANSQNIPILTYLILNCDAAVLEEALSDVYTKLFEFHSDVCIADLKQRKNWKVVITSLMSGDWRAFTAGLSKLGSSEFEREVKAYAYNMWKK